MLTLKKKRWCCEVCDGEISFQLLANNHKGLSNSAPKKLDSDNHVNKLVHSQLRLELIAVFVCILNVAS